MKKRLLFFMMMLSSLTLSSCLMKGIDDDLPAYSNCEIQNFYFEYRTVNTDNELSNKLSVTVLTVDDAIDSDAATVSCTITVPASPTYPATVDDITLSELVGYCDISTAATIEPMDSAPALGSIEDWSGGGSYKYLVTAADGSEKVWTVTIADFIK